MALTTAGRNSIAGLVTGAGTAYDASNARLGVGDSSTAFNAAQTDLVAATNKLRKLVSGAPGLSTNVMTFVATFGEGEADFAWNEIALFNHASAGTMLCRAVVALGTKASGAWTLMHSVSVVAA